MLRAIGADVRHPSGFRIDRPHGLNGEWLLLQFTHAARVYIGDGSSIVPAGRLMLWSPGQPHRYEGHGLGLGNHWLHAVGLDGIVRDLRIPTATAMIPRAGERTAQAFRDLAEEDRRRAPGWETAVAGLLVSLLRAMAVSGPRAAISDLRGEVIAAMERPWSIAVLAKRLGCSVPTLHRRWRSAFGSSPVDDLINARLDRARWLIAVARHPVHEAARAVGYDDARYFARLCRQHCGVAPSHWAEDAHEHR